MTKKFLNYLLKKVVEGYRNRVNLLPLYRRLLPKYAIKYHFGGYAPYDLDDAQDWLLEDNELVDGLNLIEVQDNGCYHISNESWENASISYYRLLYVKDGVILYSSDDYFWDDSEHCSSEIIDDGDDWWEEVTTSRKDVSGWLNPAA